MIRRTGVMLIAGATVAILGFGGGPARAAHAAASCSNSWQIQASPSPGNFDNRLTSVTALSLTDAWAAGSFTQQTTSGSSTTYITDPLFEHWNGTSWSVVTGATQSNGLLNPPTTVAGEIRGVWAASASDVWAVGDNGSPPAMGPSAGLIEHWDGTAWTVSTPASTTYRFNAVWGSGPSDVWAVGQSTTSSQSTALTEHWNGTAWGVVSGADTNVISWDAASGSAANDVWVAGDDAINSARPGPAITEHWDGTAWAALTVPYPQPDGELFAGGIAAAGGAPWMAAPRNEEDHGTGGRSFALRWTGSAWEYLSTPIIGDLDELIATSSSSGNDVWFTGYSETSARTSADPYGMHPPEPDARHWDGQTLSSVRPAMSALGGDAFFAVATVPAQTWAVGASGLTSQINQGKQTLIEAICAAPANIVAEAPAGPWLPIAALAAAGVVALGRVRRAGTRPES